MPLKRVLTWVLKSKSSRTRWGVMTFSRFSAFLGKIHRFLKVGMVLEVELMT